MSLQLNIKSNTFTIRLALIVCLTFGITQTVWSQKKVLKFESYTKDNGLLHSYVLDVLQDKEGYVWIGSYGGLNRFDGTNFNSYSDRTAIKMPTNVIHKIHEPLESNGEELWLGTDNGLMKLHKPTMTFTHYEYNGTGILAITENNDGILWLGTEHKGLVKFDRKTKKYHNTSLTKSESDSWGNKIKAIHRDNLGNLWIGGSKSGLILYNPNNDSYERYTNAFATEHNFGNTVTYIYKYQNRLMLGTAGAGLFLFDKNTKQFSRIENRSTDNTKLFPIISGIAPDHEGDLWFSTLGGGMFEVQLKDQPDGTAIITSLEQYTKNDCGSHSISNNIIEVLHKDQTGNFWMGTLGGGLSRLDFYNHKFDHYQILEEGADRFDQRSVISVGKDAKGNIWYGTQADGIYIYSPDLNPLMHIAIGDQDNTSNVIRQIYNDKENRMWLTVDGGIYVISADGKKKNYFDLSENGLEQGNIHSICIDKDNRLWFGVFDFGVYRAELPPNPFTFGSKLELVRYHKSPTSQRNLSSNLVWAIHEDKDGQLWVGSDKGLDIYDEGSDSFLRVLDKNVSCITESNKVKSNTLWIGTYGNGLYLMNKTDYTYINFSTDNGFSNNNINGILEDGNGHIWVGTEKGISAIDPNGFYNTDLSSITGKQVNSSRVRTYYVQDGLQGHEFHLNANELLKDGRLLFGGPKGFNIFDPQNILENTFVFPAKVNDFKLLNNSIIGDSNFTKVPEYMDSISLEFRENYFTIELSQVCLSNPELAKYQYMLEGYDKDWITTEAVHRRITYTGIPEGDYTLKIKSINPDGYVSDQVTKLAIHIEPPWYRTTLVRIAAITILLILLALVYRAISLRSKKRHKTALKLQQQAFEKEKLETDLEYKNRELSASAMYLLNRNEKLIEIKDLILEAMRKLGEKDNRNLNNIINTIDNVLKGQDNWENFEKNFNRIDTDFTKRLIEAYPNLSNNDVKICTYMRMNLSSKEIAGLLNIAPKSLETSRLRIRKKMGLDSSIYLSDFILKF